MALFFRFAIFSLLGFQIDSFRNDDTFIAQKTPLLLGEFSPVWLDR